MTNIITVSPGSLKPPKRQPGWHRFEAIIDTILGLELEDRNFSWYLDILAAECHFWLNSYIPTADLARILSKLMEAASRTNTEWAVAVVAFIEAQTGDHKVIEQWLDANKEWTADTSCNVTYCKQPHFTVLTREHLKLHIAERQVFTSHMEEIVKEKYGENAVIGNIEHFETFSDGAERFTLTIVRRGKEDEIFKAAGIDDIHQQLAWIRSMP